MFLEELLHRVCVPFVDPQSLDDLPVFIQQFDDRVCPAGVANLQPWELTDAVAADKGLDLWESTQFSLAHNQLSKWVFSCAGVLLLVFLATLETTLLDYVQLEVAHLLTRGTHQVVCEPHQGTLLGEL